VEDQKYKFQPVMPAVHGFGKLLCRAGEEIRHRRLAICGAGTTQICRQKADNINSFVLKFKAEGENGRAAVMRGLGPFSRSLKTITICARHTRRQNLTVAAFRVSRLGGRRRVRDELPVVVMLSHDDGATT
jgi:hypothetical protein